MKRIHFLTVQLKTRGSFSSVFNKTKSIYMGLHNLTTAGYFKKINNNDFNQMLNSFGPYIENYDD